MRKQRSWFWNLILFLALVLCTIAFIAHYKNWIRQNPDHIQIVSGIYYTELPYGEIDSVVEVAHLPGMERLNGFSAFHREKGVFLDSISGNKVQVFVDDLAQPKIKIVHQDSLYLYLNLSDSLETQKLRHWLLRQTTIIDSIAQQ